MSATDIVERIQISDVAERLGVKLDRTRRRDVAVWRKGKNFSVSFNDAKGVWHDFVTNQGGGVIDFVVKVLGCDRGAAMEWLAADSGVRLDGWHRDSKRKYAQRMQVAKTKAEALVRWKLETLERLRIQRDVFKRIYHHAVRFVLSHAYEWCESCGDVRYELAIEIGETYWLRVEEFRRND
jgi:DNA primase